MTAAKNNTSFWIKFAIMIALTIGIGLLPPFGEITPMGMKILGVFVGTLFGWMCVDFVISSCIGLLFLGLSGYYPTVVAAFQDGFGNMIIVNLLITFGFAQLLNEINLTGALANWILSRKFINGHPWLIVLALFIGPYMVAAFAEPLAAILVFWSICYKIGDQVGYKPHSKEIGYLLTGVIFFANAGSYFFPFKPYTLGFAGGYITIYGDLPQFQWYFCSIVFLILFSAFYVLVGKIVKFDIEKINIDISQYTNNSTWGKKEKWGLAFVAFFVAFMTLPTFIPGTALAAFLNKAGIIGATGIILAAAYVITVDGERLMDNPAALYKKGVSWDLIFMMIATMPIGAALRSADGGIITTLLGWLMGAVGSMHWIAFTMVCALLMVIFTQVSHNLILATVLFPVFAPICEQLGGDPLLWFIINFWAVNAAFATPAASAWAGLLHANKDYMTVKTAYGFGSSFMIVVMLAAIVLIPLYTLVW